MSSAVGLIETVRVWKELYRLYPRATVIVTVILIIGAIGVGAFLSYKDKTAIAELERKRKENLTYNQQLDALNNVQGSLNNLIQFVETQKVKLKESEDLINSLKIEQEKLKPVVEADRKTVDALLDLQDQKAQSNVWKERLIGFVLGFASSILASLVISWIGRLLRRRKDPSPPQAPIEAASD